MYCGNKPAWEKVWAHAPRVQITDKESEFKKFVEHKKYDKVRPCQLTFLHRGAVGLMSLGADRARVRGR